MHEKYFQRAKLSKAIKAICSGWVHMRIQILGQIHIFITMETVNFVCSGIKLCYIINIISQDLNYFKPGQNHTISEHIMLIQISVQTMI